MKPALEVMLCDGSAIAALGADRLVETALQWNVKLAVTELMHEREFKGVAGWCADQSPRIEALEPAVLERTFALRRLYPQLALTDASTLALAAQRSWLVLTHNAMVQRIAAEMAVPWRCVEWLREETARRQAVTPQPAAVRRVPTIREEQGTFTCFA